MIFNWFYIFNTDDFLEFGLTSKTYSLDLGGTGLIEDVLVTKGALYGITYKDVFLPLQLNDVNPFSIDGYGIYVDENNNVWLGIEVEDDE
jgi:hypothetical protein